MFMAANSPLIQQRLHLLVSQGTWILKPFPLLKGRVLKTFLAMQVWLSLQLFCADHIKAFTSSREHLVLCIVCLSQSIVRSLCQVCAWVFATNEDIEPPALGYNQTQAQLVVERGIWKSWNLFEVRWSGSSLIQNKYPFQ